MSKVANSQLSADDSPAAKLGQYAIIREIGEGTWGKVKLGVHVLTGHRVALKFMSKAHINGIPKMKMRLTREIEYMRSLDHPHIVKLYEVISTPSHVVLVMEYAGGELFHYIVTSAAAGAMSETHARRFFQQIMYALVYAHTVKNIAHRDIKPENVLLDENFNIKITDFGLSSEISDGDFLKTFCGSPNYAAPEVISGKPYVGTEIDVWSCGVMLYLMLTGHLPFMDDHNPSLYRKIAEGVFYMPPRLDPNAKYLITHMLQVDPFKRLSVQQVLENEWTKENLPPYIMRVSLPKPPVLGMLSSLVRKKQPVVKGIGRIDESILTELAGLLGVTTAEVAGALDKEGENAIKVAYRICKDFRKIGRDLNDIVEEEEGHLNKPTLGALDTVLIPPTTIEVKEELAIQPVIPVLPLKTGGTVPVVPPSQVFYDEEYDEEDEQGSFESTQRIDWTEGHHFAVLDSSLVGERDRNEPQRPLFGPQDHHLVTYSQDLYAKEQSGRNRREKDRERERDKEKESSSGEKERHRHRSSRRSAGVEGTVEGGGGPRPRSRRPKLPKWQFGIRSSSPPMEVMAELYKTFKRLGIEWREKPGKLWGSKGRIINRDIEDQERDMKEFMDIFLIEARWRVRNVVVRMDIQLYQLDGMNFVVDFRNAGYYKATESSHPPARFDTDTGEPFEEGEQEVKNMEVSNSFLFLDCACQLIIELAGGT